MVGIGGANNLSLRKGLAGLPIIIIPVESVNICTFDLHTAVMDRLSLGMRRKVAAVYICRWTVAGRWWRRWGCCVTTANKYERYEH